MLENTFDGFSGTLMDIDIFRPITRPNSGTESMGLLMMGDDSSGKRTTSVSHPSPISEVFSQVETVYATQHILRLS